VKHTHLIVTYGGTSGIGMRGPSGGRIKSGKSASQEQGGESSCEGRYPLLSEGQRRASS